MAHRPTRLAVANVDKLLAEIDRLLEAISAGASARRATWPQVGEEFEPSASNLAAYLALRQQDLRPLQGMLMVLGLSSLGRIEGRVYPALHAVRASLAAIAGEKPRERPDAHAFYEGRDRLASRTEALLGPRRPGRPVGLLVTCPTEASEDPRFMVELAHHKVEAIRINCAHDDAPAWQRMIENAKSAEARTGHRLRVLMDLAGPKIRTGKVAHAKGARHVVRGDLIAVVLPGKLKMARHAVDGAAVAAECTLPEAVQALKAGEHVLYDDGKIDAVVERTASWGAVARVERCPAKGVKLKSEKGLNFPDTDFAVDALTDKDLKDLDFVAEHADGIEYSFVQSPQDVIRLQAALAARRDDWQKLWLILKIEKAAAVERLPEILVQAASRQPTAIMIARGDLAVEIGFGRTAEMQEEILWLAEAAHTPAIWATQVLEQLVSEGMPARGEMTDAAMAARAECVMLNKGPFLLEAIETLDVILERMSANQDKKTPKLRPLKSWAR